MAEERMLFAVFGTPSALTYWVEYCARTILSGALDRIHLVRANSIDAMREGISSRNGDPVFLSSDLPETSVTDVVIRSGAPAIIVLEYPEDVVGYLLKERNMNSVAALRLATQSICVLSEFSQSVQVRDIRSSFFDRPLEIALEEICLALGLDLSEERVRRAAGTLLSGASPNATVLSSVVQHFPSAEAPGAYSHNWLAPDRILIDGIAPQYSPLIRGDKLEKVSWSYSIFANWDYPGEYLVGPIALTGPRRFIICGPYLHLPKGLWRCVVEIEVAENFSGNRLRADIALGGEVLAGIEADLPIEGRYAFEIEFFCHDPYLPAEVRFELLEGAIEGELFLRSVNFLAGAASQVRR